MIKHIEDRVLRLSALVSRWKQHGNIPRIERDLALDELREIYDALLNVDEGRVVAAPAKEQTATRVEIPQPQPAPQPAPKPKVEPKVESTHAADPVADFDDAFDIDDIDEDEDIVSIINDEGPAPQRTPEPAPASKPASGGGLFSIEDIPVRKRSGRKIISLYGASASSSPTPSSPPPMPQTTAPKCAIPVSNHTAQPIVADAPASQRLGDVLGSGVKVVGDVNTADNEPIAPMNKITDLRKAIGVNDKFLLLRDLFAGDVALYERTIDALNRFEDLDECMIYIVENFHWNPDSEGAKMLVELIERKLS